MSRSEATIRLHEDADLFLEAVRFTAAETRFTPHLIEKDYFCSVLLEYLAGEDTLVFKGGTCLAKVHSGFYRLSEDLDFIVPVASDASRAERRRRVAGVKRAFSALPEALPGFHFVDPITGANNSTQYLGVVGYHSLLTREDQSIKIEVGLREPLVTPVERGLAQTLLLDPITGEARLAPIKASCMSRQEAFAEKFRAALTRRQPAIRDFFDIDHATRKQGLRTAEDDFVRLVGVKLSIPGTEALDVSPQRLADLRRQLEPQLKPVLREEDLREFDLDRAFEAVVQMARSLRGDT